MIVFDLQCREAACSRGGSFEAWFRSNADYDEQSAGGLVTCPFCRSPNVAKAPMAPSVPKKRPDGPLGRLAAAQAEMLKHSRWVGEEFADTARAMQLLKAFGGTSILIMVGVGLETMTQLESQLKMRHYDGFFKS